VRRRPRRGQRRPVHPDRRSLRAAAAAGAGQGPEAQRLGRDSGGAARRRLPGGGPEGHPDPRAHRRPRGPHAPGDEGVDRLRPVVPGDARDGLRRRRPGRLRRTQMKGVLQGLKVVEQGTFITGPACGMLLGDLGADVIKVEAPKTGDPFRAFKDGLYSPHFQTYNRNKRSITLDTRSAEDREVLDGLIADADVYIQNFRPGVADKLGVGAERLRKLNPRLIYCSISGFGATGPAADRPAYDTVAQAASGFLNLLINPENPRVVGPAIADSLTGFYAAYGV